MGTNYYLHRQTPEDLCQHCGRGRAYEEVHIGKSSGGWKFLFNSDEYQITTYKCWQKELTKPENKDHIYDEYGRKISPEELFKLIENKQKDDRGRPDINEPYTNPDPEGYLFSKYTDFC